MSTAGDESKSALTDATAASPASAPASAPAPSAVDAMIAETLGAVRARVAAAVKAASVADGTVRLIAVSKLKSNEHVMAAYKLGQRDFGENYVQELIGKAAALPEDIRWHFIGQLQSNKCNGLVKKVPNLACVQSVGSVKLANRLNAACTAAERADKLPVFVQVNTSEEVQKGGVAMDECASVVKHVVSECPNLHFEGLMTIGKLGEVAAQYFERLSACRDAVCADEDLGLSKEDVQLSMGMSADFEMAIEYGATSVRVGSQIFGARPKK